MRQIFWLKCWIYYQKYCWRIMSFFGWASILNEVTGWKRWIFQCWRWDWQSLKSFWGQKSTDTLQMAYLLWRSLFVQMTLKLKPIADRDSLDVKELIKIIWGQRKWCNMNSGISWHMKHMRYRELQELWLHLLLETLWSRILPLIALKWNVDTDAVSNMVFQVLILEKLYNLLTSVEKPWFSVNAALGTRCRSISNASW